jgi:hypothetical protein
MMAKKTEYLVTRFDFNNNQKYELRVPKGTNLVLLLERLICRELDDDILIASCLRKNAKGAYDPFQIMDGREEHKREQAQAAVNLIPDTGDIVGVYNRARNAPIAIGKTLIIAGIGRDYFVKEVEA